MTGNQAHFPNPQTAQVWTLRRPRSLPMLEPSRTIATTQAELPLASLARHCEPIRNDDVQLIAYSLTVALVEVLAGRRAPQQLQDWASVELFELIIRLCRNRRGDGLRLRSLRIQSDQRGAIEVAAHLTQDGQSRAAAVQILRRDQGWLITGLTIALRPDVVNYAGPSHNPQAFRP